MNTMDEEDTIVEEVPVYLSKSLAPNLYVIQFPIKNKSYSLDKAGVTNCCVKPVAQQLKIDFKVDTATRYYDAFKGKMLAETADGNKPAASKTEHPTFDSGRMDKVSFVSSISVEDPRYAFGMMLDKELHLVPVKTFLQMRQNYSYFDKGDKRTKAEQKAENGSEDEAEDLKQVTVKFARAGDQERIKKARERSYNFISQIGADEPWCETLIYPKNSHQAEMERQKIPLGHNANDENFTSLTAKEYFSDLFNETMTLNAVIPAAPTDVVMEDTKEVKIPTIRDPLSKKQVKKLPLLDQIKMFLKDAKVLPFDQLMTMLTDPQLSAEKVLRNLTLCGVMLRGNWTLQSDILYPTDFVSLINGISADLMCRGRDYVLYKIMKNEMMTLNRQKISTITQLPVEETREVLESVANLRANRTWDVVKPPDYEFEQKHPEIAQRQETFWKAQEEKFLEMETEKSEKRVRKKSVRDSKA